MKLIGAFVAALVVIALYDGGDDSVGVSFAQTGDLTLVAHWTLADVTGTTAVISPANENDGTLVNMDPAILGRVSLTAGAHEVPTVLDTGFFSANYVDLLSSVGPTSQSPTDHAGPDQTPTDSDTKIVSANSGPLPDNVVLYPGDNWQTANDSNPFGTVFIVTAGTHIQQRVNNPKDGNRWLGEPGAVMDGQNSVIDAFGGSATNVEIQDIEIRNYVDNGVYFSSGSGVTVEGVKVFDTGSGSGETNGAIRFDNMSNLTVINNYFERVQSGVLVNSTNGPVIIERNTGLNFGRNFVQLSNVNGAGVRISHNSMEREVGGPLRPLAEDVEDHISVHKSSGTLESPIRIYNNRAIGHGPSDSGAFIILGDGGGSYQEATNNIGVTPGQVGIGLAGGTFIEARDNLMYSEQWAESNIAFYSGNYGGRDCNNHVVTGNLANWTNRDGNQNDWWNKGDCNPVIESGNTFPDFSLDATIWDTWMVPGTAAAEDRVVSTNEDSAMQVTLGGSDPETCELSFSIISGPNNGTLSTITDQTCFSGTPNTDAALVTYTPAQDFSGSETFVYRVIDADVTSDDATVTIMVNALNDPPVANNDSATTSEDTPAPIVVLANDSDADGDFLTVTNLSQPTSGTATLNGDNTVTYTPNPDFNGLDSFTYQANDGSVDSNVATVTITVNALNDPPVAVDDGYTVSEDNPLTVATAAGVLANDSDNENDPLSAILVSGPANGTLALDADGSFGYTPNPDFNGLDSFTYQANDGSVDSNVATVTITVNALNDPPVASFARSCTDLACSFDGTGSSDSDGSITNYTWIFGDGSSGFGNTVSHTYASGGTYLVSLTVTDDDGATNTTNQSVAIVTVTSINPNIMPAGTLVDVTITGSGFASGAEVTFENGKGPTPTASNIVVVDENTITATVTTKKGGPPRNRVWDVRVTNPDGSSDVKAQGFTVTP